MQKSSQPYYIATPIGELNSPHWRAIMSGPDGYKIIVIALLIRDIALACNSDGRICHPSGEPMLTEELAAVLGVDVLWLRPVLAGPLSRSGFVDGDDHGWVCNDRVAQLHFGKIRKNSPEFLPSPETEEALKRKKQEQNRIRSKLYRERQKALKQSAKQPFLPEIIHEEIPQHDDFIGDLIDITLRDPASRPSRSITQRHAVKEIAQDADFINCHTLHHAPRHAVHHAPRHAVCVTVTHPCNAGVTQTVKNQHTDFTEDSSSVTQEITPVTQRHAASRRTYSN